VIAKSSARCSFRFCFLFDARLKNPLRDARKLGYTQFIFQLLRPQVESLCTSALGCESSLTNFHANFLPLLELVDKQVETVSISGEK